MNNQVSVTSYLPALLVSGAAAVILTVAVAHGILRPFLHARGVQPWTLRDTLGSTPLLVIGAALWGAAAGFLLCVLNGIQFAATAKSVMMASAMVGVITMRFGLLALRKLT